MNSLDTLAQASNPIDVTADVSGGLLEWLFFVYGYMVGVRDR